MASDPILKTVRHLFSRMLFSLQIDPFLAMTIIAFWMFVEEDGHVGFIECLNSSDDYHLGDLISHAGNFCAELFRLEACGSNTSFPFWKKVREGIDFYLNDVCYEAVVDFLDQFEIMESVDQTGQAHEDCLKEHVHLKMELPHQQDVTPNEGRTLLVVFSDGYPLSEDELFDYFLWNFGDVEEIAMGEPNLRPDPLCALVTFWSPDTLLRVLVGEKTVQFIINGKHAWGQSYVGQQKVHFTINGKDLFCWG